MKISIFAPATIANFSVGFDSLGVALSDIEGSLFGDVVTIESADETAINMTGDFVHKLPANPIDNLVTKCSHLFHKHLLERYIPHKTFTLTLEKRMPIGSGLGSSSASIVATLVALNHFYGHPFNKQELLVFAGIMEGTVSGSVHYDNVAPCLLGGLQLITADTVSSESCHFLLIGYWFCIILVLRSLQKCRVQFCPIAFRVQALLLIGRNWLFLYMPHIQETVCLQHSRCMTC